MEDKKLEDFKRCIALVAKDRILENYSCGNEVWGALSNVDWSHPEHGYIGVSFRHAGGIVAEMSGSGDYMEWYCRGDAGVVPDWFRIGMLEHQWTCHPDTPDEEPAATSTNEA